ncbi:MAG: ADP-forming succinate--CoA ligase subunit beta [Thermoplasmata archaeon]|nr:ADP-forming succinate--CoA ligase subunit beta [Thermoplasmata archaeon]
MKIHEYQAKELFRRYGIPVPAGGVASTPEEARAIAERIGGKVVVKAQIHAGGRGKGGGVKLANGPGEAETAARAIIGMSLVTHQTGPGGKRVHKVLVEEASPIARELYIAIVLDRETSRLVIIASSAGGMDIEKVAAETPDRIFKTWVDPALGLMPFQARRVCFKLGLSGQAFKDGVDAVTNLYRLFEGEDATLAEINPFIVRTDGGAMAIDAKVNLDDDAGFRHPEHAALRDLTEEEPLETEAKRYGLNYIKLGGSVGCMVNGAGLAMATMDLIKLCGAEPANFLDVGGGASAEGVENAFRILMADQNVRCVLINIFGGIVRCDRVAQGVVEAVMNLGEVDVPIVVRLEGTNAAEGMRILKGSGLDFHAVVGFHEAAQKAADLAGGD